MRKLDKAGLRALSIASKGGVKPAVPTSAAEQAAIRKSAARLRKAK